MVSLIIVSIMALFSILGIIDTIQINNKQLFRGSLSKEFTKGIEMIGSLCLSIVGIIAIVPLLGETIAHTLSPLYAKLGLDPAFAVSTFLAIDMGGYNLAMDVATTPIMGKWAGIIYGSMMGATISFTLPVSLRIIEKDDYKFFLTGILYGFASIPIVTLIGGLMLHIDIKTILINIIPLVLFSIIIIIFLKVAENTTIKVFEWISKFINILSLIGLGLAILNELIIIPFSSVFNYNATTIPILGKLDSLSSGIYIAGSIGIVLSGALPFVYVLNKLLQKPLSNYAKKTHGTDAGAIGFLLSAANNMAMFSTMKNMTNNEKILNAAFAIGASFVIGDHLAFTLGVAKDASFQ